MLLANFACPDLLTDIFIQQKLVYKTLNLYTALCCEASALNKFISTLKNYFTSQFLLKLPSTTLLLLLKDSAKVSAVIEGCQAKKKPCKKSLLLITVGVCAAIERL